MPGDYILQRRNRLFNATPIPEQRSVVSRGNIRLFFEHLSAGWSNWYVEHFGVVVVVFFFFFFFFCFFVFFVTVIFSPHPLQMPWPQASLTLLLATWTMGLRSPCSRFLTAFRRAPFLPLELRRQRQRHQHRQRQPVPPALRFVSIFFTRVLFFFAA